MQRRGGVVLELRLLGPVEVVGNAGVLDVGGARPSRLLVALALSEHGRLTLDELVERCFDDDDRPKDPIPATRTAIRRARRAIGDDMIRTRPGGYELDLSAVDLDIGRFDALIAKGRAAADPVAAVTSFGRALELWRGRPFGELGDLDWLAAERVRLEEQRLVALEGWHDAHIRSGTVTEILPSLQATVAEHPLRERFNRQLMQALYLADRQPDALRVFQEYREALIDAGLEPGSETVALERRIAVADPTLRVAHEGRPLRGYRIAERLGEGAFSIVYRGTQPSVDRDVAIKQIRAELANRPEFIRRFETEAHLVARLEHPHIVPLYDYWREPDSAYLVMRLLRGGNLETALHRGPWTLGETLKMVSEIGGALTVAHRAGVVHRDVKPANILLDEDRNAYLTDFGIALEAAEAADPDAALSAGSPAYASPEQLRRLPVGPPADVHGLAIATYEALTGRLPFPDEPNQAAMLQRQLHDPIPLVRNARPDLPAVVDDVLSRATAKDPADRYQSVEAFVAALQAAAGMSVPQVVRAGVGTMVAGGDERNPYKGLRAFDEADAGDFAGRARLVDQLSEALGTNRLVAVVGPSGSGKSSAVRAGLLPAVRRGAIPGSADWFVTTLLPGPNPFEELETALLRVASIRPAGLLGVLGDGPRGIARGVRQVVPEENAQVLLVIDQFEELFTLADPGETARFLDALATAVTEERSRLRVVLTLRADFYDRPLRHDAIGRLVKDATVAVLPLAPDELEHAIVDPAHAVGARFEAGLVSEIAADVADQPGALPLLQYVLTELYERHQSGLMTSDAYRELGGVAGALGRRAEELHEQASEAGRRAIRRVFGRLVSLGEGTEDTRRRALRDELGTDDATSTVIDSYGKARLLSFDRDPMTREPTVEVAHEALLREWPRLRTWLDEDRDGLRVLRHLHTTATEWDRAGRPESELYRGGRLEAAEECAATNPDDLRPLERDFVDSSVQRRTAEQEAERRGRRRLQRLLAGVAIVALLALVAGAVAFQQRSTANDQRAAAEDARFAADTESLAAEAAARAEDDPQLALLLAAEAYRRSPGPQTLGALQRVLVRTGNYLGVLGAGRSYHHVEWLQDGTIAGMGPDGVTVFGADGAVIADVPTSVADIVYVPGDGNLQTATLAAAGSSTVAYVPSDARSELHLLDAATGEVTVLDLDSDVSAVEVSAAGDVVFALEADGPLRAFDAHSGSQIWQASGHPEKVGGDLEAFDPVGRVNVTGWVSPFGTAESLLESKLDRRPPKLALSGDGSTLVSAASVVVRRWEAGDGSPLGEDMFTYVTTDDRLPSIAFVDELAVDETGDRFAYAFRDMVFAHSFGEPSAEYGVVVETAGSFYGRPKTDALIWGESMTAWTVLTDGRAARVDLSDGSFVGSPLRVPFEGVRALSVAPDDRSVAVASDEGIAILALDGDRLLAEAVARHGLNAGWLNPERGLMTLASAQTTTFGYERGRLYDIAADVPVELDHPALDTLGAFWSRDGRHFAAMINYAITTFDLETGERLVDFEMPGSWVAHAFSPDGGYLAINDYLGVEVLDVVTGDQVAILADLGPYPSSVSFSSDGRHVAATQLDGSAAVWEVDAEVPNEGSVPGWRRVDDGELEGATSLLYSPDGRWLATVDAAGVVALRDPATFDVVTTLAAELEFAGQYVFAFADGGDRLMLTGRENAELWDVPSRQQIGDPFPNDPDFWAVAVDGPQIGIATGVGEWALIWNLDTDQWFDIACRAAGRNLTPTEWAQFGPADAPYEITCEQWPDGVDESAVSALGEGDLGRSLSNTQPDDD